jgi:hypothetical protein
MVAPGFLKNPEVIHWLGGVEAEPEPARRRRPPDFASCYGGDQSRLALATHGLLR